MMFVAGFLVATVLVAPIAWMVGFNFGRDVSRSHELADIKPALERSVR